MSTVTIKALTNLGTIDYPSCPIREGETAEVSHEVAAKLVANRHGVVVDMPPESVEVESSTGPTADEQEVETGQVDAKPEPQAESQGKRSAKRK